MIIVLTSYFNIILAILRIRSSEGRQKAFSTCASHMMAVTVFYGTLLFMYLQPRTNHSLDTDKMASVFYTLVIPMLNLLIYSLRNKDVKDALKRFLIKLYALYDHFYVANEFLKYRLHIGNYNGTAGDALRFSKHYNHDLKFFTTPDRDNDRYPSGNCGLYYSSGWWFDACLSANLNGKYYHQKYRGVRNGIFWGTWPGISEAQPGGYKSSFKEVKMMIRPKHFKP